MTEVQLVLVVLSIAALPLIDISLPFFLLTVAFLMSGAAVLASASVSNLSTAENFRPIAWATKNAMLTPALRRLMESTQ